MLMVFALSNEQGSNQHWQALFEHVASAITNCATHTPLACLEAAHTVPELPSISCALNHGVSLEDLSFVTSLTVLRR